MSRRRARSVRRLSDATLRSRSLRPQILPAYWWDVEPNFGDALTPWVLARYRIAAVHTLPNQAKISGVGSILEQLGGDFTGKIWGSGLIHGDRMEMPEAEALAVRGPLTKAALGITDDVALGDPGLLVARHVSRRRARWRLGVVPHASHRRDGTIHGLVSRAGSAATVVDVRLRPGPVVHHIAQCSAILTTSLHGLIVADALEIPAVWTQRQPALVGADFKFRDYESVVTPGRTREVVIASDTTLADVLNGASIADTDARAESIRRLEETLALLPTVSERPWRAFALRGRGV